MIKRMIGGKAAALWLPAFSAAAFWAFLCAGLEILSSAFALATLALSCFTFNTKEGGEQ